MATDAWTSLGVQCRYSCARGEGDRQPLSPIEQGSQSSLEQLEWVCRKVSKKEGREGRLCVTVAPHVNARLVQLTCALLHAEQIEKHAEHDHRDTSPHVNTEALFDGVRNLWQGESEGVSRKGENTVCEGFRDGVSRV